MHRTAPTMNSHADAILRKTDSEFFVTVPIEGGRLTIGAATYEAAQELARALNMNALWADLELSELSLEKYRLT